MPLSDIIMAKKIFGEGGSGGPTVVKEKDVNFYDYDGTLVASYTKAEAQALTELPAAPDHSEDDIPLTFQSWNYTLAQVNAITLALDVGATYISADGKTHILVTCNQFTGSVPSININKSDTSTLTIDWGDGKTATTSASGLIEIIHTGYSIYGKYHITMWISNGSGTFILGSNTNTKCFCGSSTENAKSVVTKVVIGESVTGINSYAFHLSRSLETLIIPNNVNAFSDYAVQSCYELKALIIPNGVTSLGLSFLNQCYRLRKVVIPSSITSLGSYSFYQNYGLKRVVIPSSITSIAGYAFYQCYAITDYYCLRSTPPTLGATTSFTNILATCLIHVLSGSLAAYQSATNWVTYKNYMVGG